ncbi:NPCBM/NEW2 domain-containing protein [Kribbella deserti]|uniref:NPCBM/NEW2 domain-containing protein n=1 Tax=Kribbella deserti TaxID=1926257 RepID=A0ABV6QL94_9ACTN
MQGIFIARTGGVVSDLTLAPEVPAGWALVAGQPVRKSRLAAGQSVSAKWTLKLLRGGVRGDLELVVAGNYTAPDGRRVYSADVVPIFADPLPPTGSTYVSDLPWTDESNGYGRAQQRDHSHGGDRPPGALTIAGKTYAKGVGSHAPSSLTTWLGANCSRFVAEVGVDDGTQTTEGSVGFIVVGDGRELARTPVIRAGETAHELDLNVTGVKRLTLATTDGGNGKNSDHANWALPVHRTLVTRRVAVHRTLVTKSGMSVDASDHSAGPGAALTGDGESVRYGHADGQKGPMNGDTPRNKRPMNDIGHAGRGDGWMPSRGGVRTGVWVGVGRGRGLRRRRGS